MRNLALDACSCLLASAVAAQAPTPTAPPGSSGAAAAGPEIVGSRCTWFQDVSDATGTTFKHEDGAFSYSMGSGVAWIDLEADGDLDLILQSALGTGATLRNDGGKFTDVTASTGPATQAGDEPIGISCADFDQDGLTDAYYSNVSANRLFKNLGGGFTDVAPALGVTDGQRWSTSASWADFDLDGDLDLYVGNYVRILNFPYHYGAPNALFENGGAPGAPQFLDVAPALGVDNVGVFGPSVPGYSYVAPTGQPTAGCTLSTGTLDYDEDGDPDLMVGNDFGLFVLANKLYRNDQSGAGMAFTDVSSATGFDTRPHYNMGIVPCDYDHDGDWDFYDSNLGDNLLLRNDGGAFVDATYAAGPVSGVADSGLLISSWGMIFQDFDNDGWEDIVVANGYIPAAGFIANEKRIECHLWASRGDGTFWRVPDQDAGHADKGPGRAVAAADYDGDGRLDFYLQNNGAPFVATTKDRSRLYQNTGLFSHGTWLELDVAGRLSNREGFGTRIEVEANGTTWRRQVLGDPVYLSSPSRMVHVGLGDVANVDRISVHWPSGIEQAWFDVGAEQRLELLEPAVTVETIEPLAYAAGTFTLSAKVKNHDALDHGADARFRLRIGGATVLDLTQTAVVPSGSELIVSVDQPIDPAVYAAIQGTPVEVLLSLSAAGALDEERAAQTLP